MNAKDNNPQYGSHWGKYEWPHRNCCIATENGADVNMNDDDGMTALSAASEAGETEVVRELLKNGADVNCGR